MSDYATSKLITALGMFIHDLWAMRYDTEGTYDETAYYNLADEIERRCRFDKGEKHEVNSKG